MAYTRRRATRGLAEQVRASAAKPPQGQPSVEFLSTGSIVLNLAASQRGRDGGWARGHINNVVGDGSTGKTLLALEACAWIFYNVMSIQSKIFPPVNRVYIVYNNRELFMDFPIDEMYGEHFANDWELKFNKDWQQGELSAKKGDVKFIPYKLAKKLVEKQGQKKPVAEFIRGVDWIFTETCEEFGRDVKRRVSQLAPGDFLFYVQDSIDALVPKAQKDRAEAAVEADMDEKAGQLGEKAAFFSQKFFGHLTSLMKDKDATLLLISQVRERIGVTFGKKIYRAGGKALSFYTHQVPWLYEKEQLKGTFRGKERKYGIRAVARYERNKTAKPYREAEFVILFDYGVDDIGSMLNYLYGPKDKKIKWFGEDSDGIMKSRLVRVIERDQAEYDKLVDMVEKDWYEVEKAVVPARKKKYDRGR